MASSTQLPPPGAPLHPGQLRSLIQRRMGQVLLHALLFLGVSVTLLPFAWMLLGSFKSSGEIIQRPPTFWPQAPTFQNYLTILQDPSLPLLRFYLNSLFVSLSVVSLVLFTSSLAGFIFAKYEFFGKDVIFGFVLATLMIPFQVLMIPSYLILVKLGLIDSLWGLVVPGATSAFGIFLMKQFIQGLPSELMDAARIDGASEWGIYWRVIVPQVGPALATLGILTFMGSWNSYLWPLIVITSHAKRTLPIVLTWFNSMHGTRYDLTMSASALVVVPILIVSLGIQGGSAAGLGGEAYPRHRLKPTPGRGSTLKRAVLPWIIPVANPF